MKKHINILKKKLKNYNPKLKEECGVFGISDIEDASALTALGLHALQHRGQEGCGIVTFDGEQYYSEKSNKLGPLMRDFEKQIVLQVIDNAWKEHLGAIEYLRQGIGLRGYASKNPKLEFRRESFELFERLLENIRVEAIKFLTRVEIEIKQDDLQRPDRHEIVTKQEGLSSFEPPASQAQQTSQQNDQNSGNRRQRRREAKMARKKNNKKG